MPYCFLFQTLHINSGIILESGFIYAAKTSEIERGKTKKVTLGDWPILLVNVEGKFYAVDGLCTHYGGDLSEGQVQGKILTCPVHGAKFDVTTGKVFSSPTEPLGRPDIENLTSYLLKIENNEIFVKII
jgi:3-phenylpropionate/trans-cinnamate dioxygenase ferredoxin subunit